MEGIVEFHAAMWKPYGREFQSIGHFKDGRVSMISKPFPNEDYGFNGRHFIITVNAVRSHS